MDSPARTAGSLHETGATDTVYLGVVRTEVLRDAGGFDGALIRNQCDELTTRLRARGGTVRFDPRLEIIYRPRDPLSGLARQYWQYGRWKRATLQRHPDSIRWRQVAPYVALLLNLSGLLGVALHPAALAVPAGYAAGLLVTTVVAAKAAIRR